VRLERTTPLLEQAAETLFEAIALARAEFSFLFLEARRERINRATDQFDALFDQEMFGRRLRITFQDLAAATHEVVALDRACNYQDYRHPWTDLQRQRVENDGRVLQNTLPSTEVLLRSASEVEDRFAALDQITAS